MRLTSGFSSWPNHWGMWNLGHSFQVLVSSRHRSGNTSSSGSFLTRPQWPGRCGHPWLHSHGPSRQCGSIWLPIGLCYAWAKWYKSPENVIELQLAWKIQLFTNLTIKQAWGRRCMRTHCSETNGHASPSCLLPSQKPHRTLCFPRFRYFFT